MALAIASGFLLQSTAPNFERDMFSTIAEMKSYPDASLPDVFVSTCVEDGCVYCYNKTNEPLETTGKWRKVGSGDSNIWIGTTAEYDAAATLGTIPVGTLVFITDDTADGADTGIIYDTELSATSENAVTNKAIKEALDKKVDVVDGKGLSTYDFDDTAYNKLDGIQAGANKTVCDTTIQTSNNPVTNTAIKTALDKKIDNASTTAGTQLIQNGFSSVTISNGSVTMKNLEAEVSIGAGNVSITTPNGGVAIYNNKEIATKEYVDGYVGHIKYSNTSAETHTIVSGRIGYIECRVYGFMQNAGSFCYDVSVSSGKITNVTSAGTSWLAPYYSGMGGVAPTAPYMNFAFSGGALTMNVVKSTTVDYRFTFWAIGQFT